MIKNYIEIPIGQAKDLTNQKFGKLTALYRTQHPTQNGVFWLCQCECGNYSVVSSNHLLDKHTTSCGCHQKSSRFIDISGQRFGNLTVLSYNRTQGKGHTYWNCKCDCGTIKSIRKDGLVNGTVVSCGCYNAKRMSKIGQNKAKDLTNQKFGRLTALYPTEQRKGSFIVWYCKCDCGKEKYVASRYLLDNSVQSCGCLQKETQQLNGKKNFKDLTGQRFGQLLVLEKLERKDSSHSYWKCLCDCGNTHEVRGSHLIDGNVRSCGCIHSVGEYNIQQILQKNNIVFEKEYKFQDFIYEDSKNYPRYDFYLPNYNRLIEFDGKQHYEKTLPWVNLELQQQRDKLKNEYALQHNIPLVRIPYWEKDNITIEMILGDQYLVKGE